MKFLSLSLSILLSLTIASQSLYAQDQSIHRVGITDAKKLHKFFRYKEGNEPIISGHRGGMEQGFPENSIATFENTLKYTPAFFEIDPRLTKDSVIVLMHDATLDRTTNGTGKLADFTWEEVKNLKLKDSRGNVTEYGIPKLSDVIEWARGKTILNLDKKDVPMEMIADLLTEHKAYGFVMMTVHSPEQALFYLDRNPRSMFSAHIKTPEVFEAYQQAEIPWKQVMAYIGPEIKEDNQTMYQLLHAQGVKCMISSASTYDKLKTEKERTEKYRAIAADGADVIESDLPIEVSKVVKNP